MHHDARHAGRARGGDARVEELPPDPAAHAEHGVEAAEPAVGVDAGARLGTERVRILPLLRQQRDAHRAEADREQRLLLGRPVRARGLLVVAEVAEAHGAARLEHHAVEVHRRGRLGDQRGRVLPHLGPRGAQRVGVRLAERVDDAAARVARADRRRVREHDPRLDPQARRARDPGGPRERVRADPRGVVVGPELAPGPLAHGQVQRGRARVDDAVARMQRRRGPHGVVGRGDGHAVGARRPHPRHGPRVVDQVPRVGAEGDAHRTPADRSVWASRSACAPMMRATRSASSGVARSTGMEQLMASVAGIR